MLPEHEPDGRIPFAEVAGVLHGGRYRIEAEVGSGSAGTVYRARDVQSGETVALKLVDESSAHRFMREATTLARLSHPAIVRYIGHGESQGRMFLAMEWLDGEDLEKRLDRGALGWEGACLVGLRIAEALAQAHALGLVHRDLGPRNVFLPGRKLEAAKLLDFGLVRQIDATVLERTRSQAILGTPYYMAPEQIRSSKNVDGRADLFSLGVLLYEMTSGRRPFEGEELFSLWYKIIEGTPAPLGVPQAPPALVALIDMLLAKDPAARPVSAAVVADVLRDIEKTIAPTAPTMSPLATMPPAPVFVSRPPPLAVTVPPAARVSSTARDTARSARKTRALAMVAGCAAGALVAALGAILVLRPRHPVAAPANAPTSPAPPPLPTEAQLSPPAQELPRVEPVASVDPLGPMKPEPPPRAMASPYTSRRDVKPSPSAAPSASSHDMGVPWSSPVVDPSPSSRIICSGGTVSGPPGRTLTGTAQQPAIVAARSCHVVLTGSHIIGPVAARLAGAAHLELKDCQVDGEIVVESSDVVVTLSGSTRAPIVKTDDAKGAP